MLKKLLFNYESMGRLGSSSILFSIAAVSSHFMDLIAFPIEDYMQFISWLRSSSLTFPGTCCTFTVYCLFWEMFWDEPSHVHSGWYFVLHSTDFAIMSDAPKSVRHFKHFLSIVLTITNRAINKMYVCDNNNSHIHNQCSQRVISRLTAGTG